MSTFQAVYYRDPSGREPVVDFLDALAPKIRAALRNQLGRLNLLSEELPHLPFPHSSQVEGELRELRCHRGRDHYRVLYARSGNLIVVLHAFPKNTTQIPRVEIDTAWERWHDFKERMNARPRRPPRAAGRDAP